MLKTTISLCLVLAAASVGCASTSNDTSSSAAAETATDTITLADAETQLAAVRKTFEPTGGHELLFDTGLGPAYFAALKPIFARTALTDKIRLSGDAFGYTSAEVVIASLVDGDLLDDAVPASYQDLASYGFYYGLVSTKAPGYWQKLRGLASRSKDGALTDLEILDLVSNAQAADFVTGLEALGWSAAPKATKDNAGKLFDSDQAFGALMNHAFGEVQVVADGSQHDLDASDAFTAKVLSQSLSELRLLGPKDGGIGTDDGVILYSLSNHLTEAKENSKKDPAVGLAIAKSSLTAAEMQNVEMHL